MSKQVRNVEEAQKLVEQHCVEIIQRVFGPSAPKPNSPDEEPQAVKLKVHSYDYGICVYFWATLWPKGEDGTPSNWEGQAIYVKPAKILHFDTSFESKLYQMMAIHPQNFEHLF